jgi:MFS transporter, putative metabolite transport protein
MPLALKSVGASRAMAIGAAIALGAFIICYFLAPETHGISLLASSVGAAEVASGSPSPLSEQARREPYD